ncbi:MAG: LysM peptidoglycan-binding domain-containing protein [Actinobacteria bacterium]|nr:LysM peptidoglycan-binding domain-containing protein [Actinomycetota bacterium]MBU1494357.1 LysM peptidoglycan-binding domain-containing protein [Actinomycetota bacterium]
MMKLTTPARVVVLLTAIVVLTVLLLVNTVGASGVATTDGPVEYGTHLVVAGDTLWDIAADSTTPGEDVRRVVFEIQRLNDLEGSVILPGQVLRVPIPG